MTTFDHRPAPPMTQRPVTQRPVTQRRASRPPSQPAARRILAATGVHGRQPVGPAPTQAAWERNSDRRDRVALALSELFAERDDLGGVSTVADVLSEDLLWSV